MFTSKSIKHLLAVLPLLALAGCGGTDGLDTGYPSSPSTVNKPVGPGVNGGSALAVWTPGMSWKYNVSGTISYDYVNTAGAVATTSGQVTNGLLTRVVNTAPAPYPTGCVEVTDTFTYTLQGGTPTVEVENRYYSVSTSDGLKAKTSQKSGVAKPAYQTGSLTLIGEDRYSNQLMYVGSTGTSVPATFTSTTNLSDQANGSAYNPPPVAPDGSDPTQTYPTATASFTSALSVLGQETVPALDGSSYTAWKTQSSLQTTWENNGLMWSTITSLPSGWVINTVDNETWTDDWVPSMGVQVKTHYTLTEKADASMSYSITKTSAGVPTEITYSPQVTLNKTEKLDMVLAQKP